MGDLYERIQEVSNVVWKSTINPQIPGSPSPSRIQGKNPGSLSSAQGERVLGWNKGDIAPLGQGDTSSASREPSDEAWAPGWPLSWAADANQASLSHCLAWKQGFQKHTFLVNKPEERKTSLEANKGTPSVSQARQGAETWKEVRARPERRRRSRCGHTGWLPPWSKHSHPEVVS